jgi:hypothetical protein
MLVFSLSSPAAEWQASVYGGASHVFSYGSEEDYVMGGNDFPVTPAHTPVHFGAILSLFLNRNIGLELNGTYILPSSVTLRDPSDQDTVVIDTSPHFSLALNFVYRFLKGRFRPYVFLGGGLDFLIPNEATYTSQYGYEITMVAPTPCERRDLQAQGGGGVNVFISKRIGIRLDVRYIMIFDAPDRIDSFSSSLGVFLRLE